MVQLCLHSPKGNQGLRYFPFSGSLGLTPIKVEGAVRTKLDDDAKHLPAKSITISVRCYESRIGRLGTQHSNVLVDYTQVLWSKPDDQEWADIGDLEYPFRITLPANITGYSTTTFQEYRVFWRVEAVVNHMPLIGLGSRMTKHGDLPLIRYDIPQYPLPLCESELQTSKPRAPVVRYRVVTPSLPIGPMDLVSIPLYLNPIDPSVTIRSASLIVERRILLHQVPGSASAYPPPPTPPSHVPSSPYSSCLLAPDDSSTSIMTDSTATVHQLSNPPSPLLTPSASASSFNTDSTMIPLLPHLPSNMNTLITSTNINPPSLIDDVPSKTVTTSVAGVESSGRFAQNDGTWTKTLTFQWPAAKSQSRWAMGETMQTELASVRFFVRIKVIVSSRSGTESLELSERELFIVPTNEAERQLAASKYNEAIQSISSVTRSKSKSPRRSKREVQPPSPQSPPIPYSTAMSGGLVSHSQPSSLSTGGKKRVGSRRPHTSAGPRDKPYGFALAATDGTDEGVIRRRQTMESRPDTAHGGISSRLPPTPPPSKGGVRRDILSVPRLRASTSNTSGTSTSGGSNSEPENSKVFEVEAIRLDQTQVIAWEEELARIEAQSRQSSMDMLSSYFGRKRVGGQEAR